MKKKLSPKFEKIIREPETELEKEVAHADQAKPLTSHAKRDGQLREWRARQLSLINETRTRVFFWIEPRAPLSFHYRRNGPDDQAARSYEELALSTLKTLHNDEIDLTKDIHDYIACPLAQRIMFDLRIFESLVAGDRAGALPEIAKIAHFATVILSQFTEGHEDELKEFAQSVQNWPVLMGAGWPYSDPWKARVDQLGVGSSRPALAEEVFWRKLRPSKVFGGYVLEMLVELNRWRDQSQDSSLIGRLGRVLYRPRWRAEETAGTLPPFSADSAERWAAAVWDLVLEMNSERPQDNPMLRERGKHRAMHSERRGAQKATTAGAMNANIRDGIRERVKREVRQLALKVAFTGPDVQWPTDRTPKLLIKRRRKPHRPA